MSLDLLDKKIMYELDLNSRSAVTKIAKKVRAKKETVNFRIRRLLDENYVKGFYTVFNTAKLGYFYYKVFMKFNNTTPEKESEMLLFISAQHCAYLGSCEGPYDAIFLIMVRNSGEFKDFLEQLTEKFGDYILEKEIHTVLTTHRINEKFLFSGPTKKHVYYHDKIEQYALDPIDKKIIKILSNDARTNLVEIGQSLNVHPKVVNYHIKKLEKDGIILCYVSAPNFEKLGLQFVQINITLKRLSIIPSVIEFFDQTKKCLFALELIGKYDLTIEIHVENHKMLRDIMENFKKMFVGKYLSYDIFTVYKEHLVVWSPF